MKGQATADVAETPGVNRDPSQKYPAERPARGSGFFLSRLLTKKGRPTGRKTSSEVAKRLARDPEFRDGAPRDSGEVYRSLVNHVGVGIFRATPGVAGRFLEVNPAMEKITGYSREELLEMDVADLYLHPEERGEIVRRVLSGDLSGPVEVLFKKKDGTVIAVRDTKVAVTAEDGHAIYLEGFLEDITEHRKAEEELRQSREKYTTLVEKARDGIIVVQDERVAYASPVILAATGYSSDEMLGKPFLDLIAPEGRRAVADNYRKRMAADDLLDIYPAAVVTKDGRRIDVEVSAGTIEYEGRPAGMAVVRDVTERKRAEEALRQSEEKLRAIFQSVAEGVAVVDLDGVVIEANPALLAMHGLKSRDDMVGRPTTVFVAPEDHEKLRRSIKRTIEQGVVNNDALTGIRADGQRIALEVTAGIVRDKAGDPVGSVVTVRDVTEAKRMQEQFRAQDRLASIGELVSGVAHEINNPLTGVIGFSELLLSGDIPADIRGEVDIISKEAQRAARIVKDLLTFARKHTPAKQLSQINSIVEDVVRLRGYEERVNNIEVVRDLAPDLPEVTVDPYQMQQVFLNIVVNAEYFMAEAHKRGKLTITTKRIDGVIRISFADDGPGIAPGDVSRIFDPFFTTKPVGKGTGLGLSICHGIVSEHGGRTYATSELGKGATVVVDIPLDLPLTATDTGRELNQ